MADPREGAMRSILERNSSGGLGVNLDIPAPARSPMDMATERMKDAPFFVSKQDDSYSLGAQTEMGGYGLGGKANIGGDEAQFELMAKKLGVSPQELRVWLAMRGSDPSRAGASWQGNPASARVEANLPPGERAVSGQLSYNLGKAGTLGAGGRLDIENPQQSTLSGSYSKPLGEYGTLGAKGTYNVGNPRESNFMATYGKKF